MESWEFSDVEGKDTAVDSRSIGGVIGSDVDNSTCDEDGVDVGANVVNVNVVADEEINGSEVSGDDDAEHIMPSLE